MDTKMSKVIIYSSFGMFPVFEYELDIAQTLIDHGNEVIFIFNSKYDRIYKDYYAMNHASNYIKHKEILSKFLNGIKWINSRNGQLKIIDINDVEYLKKNEINNDIQRLNKIDPKAFINLKEYLVRGMNIYDTAFSGLMTIENIESYRPSKNQIKKYLKNQLKIAIKHFHIAEYILEKEKPDKVYLFNGRLPQYSPIIHLSKQNKVLFNVYEYPIYQDTRYLVTDNYIPHNINLFSEDLYRAFTESEKSEIIKISEGSNYIKSRVNRTANEFSSSWSKLQTEDLSVKFESGKKVLSIFTSTEAEFASIQSVKESRFFKNQKEPLQAILNLFNDHDHDYDIFIRIHPNAAKDRAHQNDMNSLAKEYNNVTVIDPQSSIDTYKLIKDSNYIFTCGSTVSMEAAFLMKKVYTLGPSVYEKFIPDIHIHSYKKLTETVKKIINNENIFFNLDMNKKKSASFYYALMNVGVNPVYVKGLSYTKSILVRDKIESLISANKRYIYLSTFFEIPLRISRGIKTLKENKKYRKKLMKSPIKIIFTYLFTRKG